MKAAQDIVIAPVITEKSMIDAKNKKYTFKGASDSNTVEIANAVETLFGVKVESVNTVSVRGRNKRVGRYSGTTSAWKKAIVTLTEKSKTIEFFDGLM